MALFSKNKVALDAQSISTLITEGAILDGNLTAPAFARIDGRVMGDVKIEQGLILGEKGVIIGNVTTKELVVYGTIQGNLNVHSLDIKASGKITGEIKTHALSVESGAIYNGNLSMNQSSKPAQLNGVYKPQPEIELVDELG